MTRTESVAGVVSATLVVLVLAYVGVNWPSPTVMQPNGDIPDVIRDWLSVVAVTGEGAPTDDLNHLAQTHLGMGSVSEHSHPRTPGALLLQMPLTLIPVESVWPSAVAVVALGVGIASWAAARIAGWRWWAIPLLTVGLSATPVVIAAILVGSQMPLVAVLLAAAWLRREKADAGVWVGVAATLKLFPGLLIPMLWVNGQRRMAYVAAGTFAGVNAAGLLLPDVSLMGQWGTMFSDQTVAHNWSLGLPLWVTALGVVGMVVWSRRLTIDAMMAAGSVGMIALSPVVWNHYLIVLLVPTVWLVARLRRRVEVRRPVHSEEIKSGGTTLVR